VTACGTPETFEDNRKVHWLSGEYDLNNNITFGAPDPGAPYDPGAPDDPVNARVAKAHRLLRCFGDSGESPLAQEAPHLCFPETHTLHVEITPPPSLRPLLRHLWTDDWPSGWLRWRARLYGNKFCVRGPFVGDTGHAVKAEIHPAQVLWWNEADSPKPRGEFSPDGPFALFVVQDASARFTKKHHFVLSKAPPPGSEWVPWAAAPIDTVFKIGFWAKVNAPSPTFTVAPYSHGNLVAPARAAEECSEANPGRIRVCTQVQPRPVVHVEVCRCVPKDCTDEGYLGTLSIRTETGSSIDWRENSLAMRVSDSRQLVSRAVGSGKAGEMPQPREPRCAQTLVTWKPSRGTVWMPVKPRKNHWAEDLGKVEQMIGHLFGEAGWPGRLSHPLPSLWYLPSVDLEVDAALEGLAERDSERRKVEARFSAQRVEEKDFRTAEGKAKGVPANWVLSELNDHQRPELPPIAGSNRMARLDFGSGEDNAFVLRRADIAAAADVSVPSRKQGFQCPDDRRWRLWTHGLGAEPKEDWLDAATRLCDEYATRGSVRPLQDLRILIDRYTKDEVVSMTELSQLVATVRDICSPELPKPQPRERLSSR
jgi:hypothetical protein